MLGPLWAVFVDLILIMSQYTPGNIQIECKNYTGVNIKDKGLIPCTIPLALLKKFLVN